jgi:hypothetical protein
MFEGSALYQNDPVWKDDLLGNAKNATIGTWGCLLTCMVMVADGFGYHETPRTLNQKMKSSGGFQGALIIPASLPGVCPGIKFNGYVRCERTSAPLDRIDNALAAGLPVIVEVDWSPRAGLQSHWVVLYSKQGDDYLMLDPYRYSGDEPGKPLLLTHRYNHSGHDPAEAITSVLWFEGPSQPEPAVPPQPSEPKSTEPGDMLTVYTAVGSLALRSGAEISADLVKWLPIHEELVVLEEKTEAEQKIGVANQWLHVRDADQTEGYVAAWYVATSQDQTVEPEKKSPQVGDKSILLQPITDGLALRTQPVISEATLIKRLPLDASLVALDQPESVSPKVGVYGEWLRVRDISGIEGFVAAWYVTLSNNPAVGAREANPDITPTQGPDLLVYTTIDNLALRNEPRIAADTLIKWMPMSSQLLLLQSDDRVKIGQSDQWIKVRDIENDVGFVAAWYVKY